MHLTNHIYYYRKKYIFCFKGLPIFCIVSYILSISIGQNTFKNNFKSIKEILNLIILGYCNILHIKWKNNILSQPFFCDIKNIIRGVYVLNNKAFPYAKYRDIFVQLGRVIGFKITLELY
jgi:hypothetical protein